MQIILITKSGSFNQCRFPYIEFPRLSKQYKQYDILVQLFEEIRQFRERSFLMTLFCHHIQHPSWIAPPRLSILAAWRAPTHSLLRNHTQISVHGYCNYCTKLPLNVVWIIFYVISCRSCEVAICVTWLFNVINIILSNPF